MRARVCMGGGYGVQYFERARPASRGSHLCLTPCARQANRDAAGSDTGAERPSWRRQGLLNSPAGGQAAPRGPLGRTQRAKRRSLAMWDGPGSVGSRRAPR